MRSQVSKRIKMHLSRKYKQLTWQTGLHQIRLSTQLKEKVSNRAKSLTKLKLVWDHIWLVKVVHRKFRSNLNLENEILLFQRYHEFNKLKSQLIEQPANWKLTLHPNQDWHLMVLYRRANDSQSLIVKRKMRINQPLTLD
jgi:hypothetical protein